MPTYTVRLIENPETLEVRDADTPYEARDGVATDWDIDFNDFEVVDATGKVIDSEGTLTPEEQAILDNGIFPRR